MSARLEFPGDAQYSVTAPLILVCCRESWQYLYSGEVLPRGVDQQQLDRLVSAGLIARKEV